MSEFWKRKIRKYFSTFDFDCDGVMSKKDFIEKAIRFCKCADADIQKTEYTKTQYLNVWEQWMKNAEIGNRDTITADELICSIGKQRYDPELMKAYSLLLQNIHDMMDVNRDGYLQEDEYQRMLFQAGVPDPSFAKEAFKTIDVNGDGKLSVEEFTNAWFDFLFSDDEKSPNAIFLGPLDDWISSPAARRLDL